MENSKILLIGQEAYNLVTGQRYLIGRATVEYANIAEFIGLKDDTVAGNHAIIQLLEDNVIVVEDLCSQTGTKVNENRINYLNPVKISLQNAVQLEFGNVKAKIECAELVAAKDDSGNDSYNVAETQHFPSAQQQVPAVGDDCMDDSCIPETQFVPSRGNIDSNAGNESAGDNCIPTSQSSLVRVCSQDFDDSVASDMLSQAVDMLTSQFIEHVEHDNNMRLQQIANNQQPGAEDQEVQNINSSKPDNQQNADIAIERDNNCTPDLFDLVESMVEDMAKEDNKQTNEVSEQVAKNPLIEAEAEDLLATQMLLQKEYIESTGSTSSGEKENVLRDVLEAVGKDIPMEDLTQMLPIQECTEIAGPTFSGEKENLLPELTLQNNAPTFMSTPKAILAGIRKELQPKKQSLNTKFIEEVTENTANKMEEEAAIMSQESVTPSTKPNISSTVVHKDGNQAIFKTPPATCPARIEEKNKKIKTSKVAPLANTWTPLFADVNYDDIPYTETDIDDIKIVSLTSPTRLLSPFTLSNSDAKILSPTSMEREEKRVAEVFMEICNPSISAAGSKELITPEKRKQWDEIYMSQKTFCKDDSNLTTTSKQNQGRGEKRKSPTSVDAKVESKKAKIPISHGRKKKQGVNASHSEDNTDAETKAEDEEAKMPKPRGKKKKQGVNASHSEDNTDAETKAEDEEAKMPKPRGKKKKQGVNASHSEDNTDAETKAEDEEAKMPKPRGKKKKQGVNASHSEDNTDAETKAEDEEAKMPKPRGKKKKQGVNASHSEDNTDAETKAEDEEAKMPKPRGRKKKTAKDIDHSEDTTDVEDTDRGEEAKMPKPRGKKKKTAKDIDHSEDTTDVEDTDRGEELKVSKVRGRKKQGVDVSHSEDNTDAETKAETKAEDEEAKMPKPRGKKKKQGVNASHSEDNTDAETKAEDEEAKMPKPRGRKKKTAKDIDHSEDTTDVEDTDRGEEAKMPKPRGKKKKTAKDIDHSEDTTDVEDTDRGEELKVSKVRGRKKQGVDVSHSEDITDAESKAEDNDAKVPKRLGRKKEKIDTVSASKDITAVIVIAEDEDVKVPKLRGRGKKIVDTVSRPEDTENVQATIENEEAKVPDVSSFLQAAIMSQESVTPSTKPNISSTVVHKDGNQAIFKTPPETCPARIEEKNKKIKTSKVAPLANTWTPLFADVNYDDIPYTETDIDDIKIVSLTSPTRLLSPFTLSNSDAKILSPTSMEREEKRVAEMFMEICNPSISAAGSKELITPEKRKQWDEIYMSQKTFCKDDSNLTLTSKQNQGRGEKRKSPTSVDAKVESKKAKIPISHGRKKKQGVNASHSEDNTDAETKAEDEGAKMPKPRGKKKKQGVNASHSEDNTDAETKAEDEEAKMPKPRGKKKKTAKDIDHSEDTTDVEDTDRGDELKVSKVRGRKKQGVDVSHSEDITDAESKAEDNGAKVSKRLGRKKEKIDTVSASKDITAIIVIAEDEDVKVPNLRGRGKKIVDTVSRPKDTENVQATIENEEAKVPKRRGRNMQPDVVVSRAADIGNVEASNENEEAKVPKRRGRNMQPAVVVSRAADIGNVEASNENEGAKVPKRRGRNMQPAVVVSRAADIGNVEASNENEEAKVPKRRGRNMQPAVVVSRPADIGNVETSNENEEAKVPKHRGRKGKWTKNEEVAEQQASGQVEKCETKELSIPLKRAKTSKQLPPDTAVNQNEAIASSIPARSTRNRTPIPSEQATIMKVTTTGFDANLISDLARRSAGIWCLVDNPMEADVLVIGTPMRSYKFLVAMARGIPMTTIRWLEYINAAKRAVINEKYFFNDQEFEKTFDFNLQKSLEAAKQHRLFDDIYFLMTKDITPNPKEMKDVITCAGGKVIENCPPFKEGQKIYLISDIESKSAWRKHQRANKNVRVITTQHVMLAIMRQLVEPLEANPLSQS